VGYKSVRDIDFTSAKTKKRKLDQAIAESSPVNHGPIPAMQLQCALTTEPSLSITNHGFKLESFIR
jgi:hypothetical protein